MGVFQNNLMGAAAAAASAGGDFYDYQITNSCRFNGTSQALERSFTSAPSDADKKAISVWIKRSGGTGTNSAFGSTTNTKICSANNFQQLEFNTNNPTGYSDSFGYTLPAGNGAAWTARRFRDPSAWLHLVWIYNSDESTTTDRIKVYFNGEQTPLSTDTDYWNINTSAQPGSGTDCGFGLNSTEMHIARYQYDDAGWWGGQMAEFIMIDGAASISDFGETKNGVWIPKDPSELTFGTNGFWLDFKSASDPGNDASGNNNDFTNIGSIATDDILTDTPTFDSSSNGGNFATFNPLDDTENNGVGGCDFAEGNLQAGGAGDNVGIASTIATPSTGKYYAEFYLSATPGNAYVGYYPSDESAIMSKVWVPSGNRTWNNSNLASYAQTGTLFKDGNTSTSSWGSTFTTGDIIQIAIDADNDAVYFGKNNTWQNSGDPTSGSSKTGAARTSIPKNVMPAVGHANGSGTVTWKANFGADGTFSGSVTAGGNADANGYGNFKYAPPSGYLALCTANIPTAEEIDPAETDDNYPQKLFSPIIWTGDGSTKAITGLGFQPDWVWIKERSSGSTWASYDSTRGNTNVLGMANTTAAQYSQSADPGLEAFGTDGFTVDYPNTGDYYINRSSQTYIAWNWRANGGTTSSNSNGSITSTVQVDPSGCFSIVKYTGESATKTIGHGLSAAPDYIIVKSIGATRNYAVYYGDNTDALQLNNTNSTDDGTYWADTSPTSTVFSVGDSNETGKSEDYIAYCFANCEGYIKSGTYLGNGNADGAFVHTGFKPAFILYKATNAAQSWVIIDNARNTYNPSAKGLFTESSIAESDSLVTYGLDILSNGFKMRGTNNVSNGSYTYLYLAMAHNPFQYATAR